MNRILCLLLFSTNSILLLAQGTDIDYEKATIGEAKNITCGSNLSPVHTALSISSRQSFPFYILGWQKRELTIDFNIGNWYAGSQLSIQ